ncbi:uncharacterized protein PHALS_01687 [Plasmopara halstedii]|uniref:Uncharacterized protein n=1 Tax=Plasmopara halstedii TaxID=4781 RepID=A0A0P1AT30_PLAHL|nr:uncharacterized protein PHALS_01687 [Plasmopara halstedii]CEG45386.1 hypothetical protein PHALS_01687 [Plasmopara halstedii]|eukprot:XP_024581755.1 hypothetical protein PHALS_01687 [Plasmopara halstedii]
MAYQSIDWVPTEKKIRNIWYDDESKSIDQNMRLGDTLHHASLTRKRKSADSCEENDRDDVDLKDTAKLAITFKLPKGEARLGVKFGMDEDKNTSLSIAGNAAKKVSLTTTAK